MTNTFGERLKLARLSVGKRQAFLAQRIKISASVWSRWENDHLLPSYGQLLLIHQVLNVSLDWLMLGIDVGNPQHQRLFLLLMRLPERELVKVIEWMEVRFSL